MREDYLNSDKNTNSKDKEFENILRPKSFNDFFGQDQILKNIKIFVKAEKKDLNHLITYYFTVLQDLEKQLFLI